MSTTPNILEESGLHDLTVAVSPTNKDEVIVEELIYGALYNGGTSWHNKHTDGLHIFVPINTMWFIEAELKFGQDMTEDFRSETAVVLGHILMESGIVEPYFYRRFHNKCI
jgi:hypothetical protein